MDPNVTKTAILLLLGAKGAQDACQLHDTLEWKGTFSSFYNELLELEKAGKVTPVARAGHKMRLWSLAVTGGLDAGVKADE